MAPVLLAPEIFQRIIFFLTHDPRPGFEFHPPAFWNRRPDAHQYAGVSRFWQYEIEREAFAYLHLDLHRLSQLNSIVTARRRAYVRNIRLHIKLPEPGPWRSRETDDEKLRNNQAFQAVLEAFLQSLGRWDAAEVHRDGIELTFHVPMPPEDSPIELHGIRIALGHWEPRYRKSVLELTDPERIARLPSAVAITKLRMSDPSYRQRNLSVAAVCALLAKLPATKTVLLEWWKSLKFASMRNDIADALSQIGHPIDVFNLCDSHYDIAKQTLPSAGTEVLREGDEDRLSKSLHVLSQRVKDFGVRMVPVNDEIFFPRAIPEGLAEPRWDRLVDFILHYPPFDPWGELLFLPDPYRDESSSESESSVDSDLPSVSTEASSPTLDIATPAIQRFYLSAARAALQMPVLRQMDLVAELGYGQYWHGFRYFVQGSSATATWTSSSGFIPEDEVLEHWHKVPKKNLQSELNVVISGDRNAV
ncbi:hypothetical protein GGI42DRAFT_333580, partial [Trichoderma sp. SZMC 28013]